MAVTMHADAKGFDLSPPLDGINLHNVNEANITNLKATNFQATATTMTNLTVTNKITTKDIEATGSGTIPTLNSSSFSSTTVNAAGITGKNITCEDLVYPGDGNFYLNPGAVVSPPGYATGKLSFINNGVGVTAQSTMDADALGAVDTWSGSQINAWVPSKIERQVYAQMYYHILDGTELAATHFTTALNAATNVTPSYVIMSLDYTGTVRIRICWDADGITLDIPHGATGSNDTIKSQAGFVPSFLRPPDLGRYKDSHCWIPGSLTKDAILYQLGLGCKITSAGQLIIYATGVGCVLGDFPWVATAHTYIPSCTITYNLPNLSLTAIPTIPASTIMMLMSSPSPSIEYAPPSKTLVAPSSSSSSSMEIDDTVPLPPTEPVVALLPPPSSLPYETIGSLPGPKTPQAHNADTIFT